MKNFFIFLLISLSAIFLTACDNGGGNSNSSHVVPPDPIPDPTPDPDPDPEPTPDPDPEPTIILPEAHNVITQTLYTPEKLRGNYEYYDGQQRDEGMSEIKWEDAASNVISNDKTIDASLAMKNGNTSVTFCVTPVTFDGVKGKITCSSPIDTTISDENINVSTDWSTDTDIIDDDKNNDHRSGISGNIHFYYDTKVVPLSPGKYNLKTLSVSDESKIERNFYDGYTMDDVYAYVDENHKLKLKNNTIRYIRSPIIRINNEDYYIISDTTINPFTTVTLNGKVEGNINNISLVDTAPAWKTHVYDFAQVAIDPSERVTSSDKIILTADKFTSDRKHFFVPFKNLSDNQFGPVSEAEAERYNANFRMEKIAYNRFDFLKYYFDAMNNFESIEGLPLSHPYINIINGICPVTDESTNACGANNVLAKYAYRLHAFKRLINHEPNTQYEMITESSYALGLADINAYANPGLLEVYPDYQSLNTLVHENSHREGYSDNSGLTYGWADSVAPFLVNMKFYHGSKNGIPDVNDPPIEESDYFADYHWIDPLTVDVHFFAKNEGAATLTNFAVMADDEESWLSFPNFFGTWGYGTGAADYNTWNTADLSGSLILDSETHIINGNTIRLKLKAPLVNQSKTLFIYATSAATNDKNGVWNTGYQNSPRDSVALLIPYDQKVVNRENGITYIAELNESDAIMRDGNSGHIGRNGHSDVGAPTYYLNASLYKLYSAEEASEYCTNNGFTGLGILPASITNSEDSELATKIMSYVYDGTIVGYDHDNPEKLVMVNAHLDNKAHAVSELKDSENDKANLILCQ